MFYAHFVLSKKGALARIWLAAHWDKKLTKANIFDTNIETSVEAIMQPQVKLALRTSGHLLLGVVRIYSRKAKYLLADCSDAIVKMKMVFRPGAVDLPEDGREAAFAAVTLQENFYEFEAFLPPVAGFDVYQSQRDEITLKEDLGFTLFKLDDGFGDIGFDDEPPEVVPDDISLEIPTETCARNVSPMQVQSLSPSGDIFGFDEPAEPFEQHEFGGEMDHNLLDEANDDELFRDTSHIVAGHLPREIEEVAVDMVPDQTAAPDQTTLFINDAEAFALGPIDATTVGTERKMKKKRKLVVDERNLIPSAVMREQLGRAGDLVVQLDLAPPTKKLMRWKEFGGVEKLLMIPGKQFAAKPLSKLYSRNLVTRSVGDQEYATEIESKRWEEFVETVDRDVGLERRRGASTAGETARDVSRVSTAMVADISAVELDVAPPREDTVQPSVSLPWADASALSDPSNVSMPRVSLPDVDMSSLLAPPSPPVTSGVPIFVDEDITIFDRTLRATDVDMASGGEADALLDDSQLMCQRSNQLMSSISETLESRRDVVFNTLVKKNTRKQVAVKFYTLLTLQKLYAVEVSQKKPYGDIRIVKGPAFTTYA